MYPKLTLLLQGYYNQDWDLEFDSDEDTIDSFRSDNPDSVELLVQELDTLLQPSNTEAEIRASVEDIEPGIELTDGTFRQWMTAVRHLL